MHPRNTQIHLKFQVFLIQSTKIKMIMLCIVFILGMTNGFNNRDENFCIYC